MRKVLGSIQELCKKISLKVQWIWKNIQGYEGIFAWYIFFFATKFTFSHNRFAALFYSMKVEELGKVVLVSCIIYFKDIQVWLRQFSFNLNACKKILSFTQHSTTMKRHVTCFVEKAGFEPRTLGTKAERYDHCSTRLVSMPAKLWWFSSIFGLKFSRRPSQLCRH